MSSDRGTGKTTGAHSDGASYASGTLSPGTRVRDYVVERFIASGGFGSVYQVRDQAGDRPAALKILHPELLALGDAFVRFLREAQVLERIRHPNIVEIYDSGSLADGRAFMVMELLSGRDLEEQIELDGPFEPARALSTLEPICDALMCAHEKGVVHRDIKASNVVLTERDGKRRIVLLDFGLAKLIEADAVDLTSSRMALGTPASMSPEQIRGEKVDARSDIYALGGLVYHMLTGKLPFDDKSRTVMQYMHLHGQRPRVSSRANVAPAVDEVISRAMATERRHRYATPVDFLAALQNALGAAPAPASAPGPTPGQAIGIYVDIRVASSGPSSAEPGDPSESDTGTDYDDDDEDALLSAMEDVLADAERVLGSCQLQPAIDGSSAILFVRVLSRDPEVARGERAAATRAALELQRALSRRDLTGLHVNLTAHVAPVSLVGDRIQGGDLMHTERWAPAHEIDGLVGLEEVFAGLDATTEPVSGPENEESAERVRLVAIAPASEPALEPASARAREPAVSPALSAELSSALSPTGAQPIRRALPTPGAPAGKGRDRAMHTEMMANIGRQVAGVVHDLRSPLSVVIGNLQEVLENAERGQPLSTDDCEALEDAMVAARQLMDTTNGLLEASALRSYSSSRRRVLSVSALLDNAVRLSDGETRDKATVHVSHRDPRPIQGSQGRLTQVLVNLLVNAAQAIPDRESDSDLESRARAAGRIDITTYTTERDTVCIIIRDNGVGMSEELVTRIFEPFFSTKEVGQGTGLGLSLVREIIEEHGGTVSVSSTPGAGSCFTIELPAAPAGAEPSS